MTTPRTTVNVGGAALDALESVTLTRSIDALADTFEITSPMPDLTKRAPVRCGDATTITIDDALVLTGYVNAISISRKTGTLATKLTCSGTSKTGDLVTGHPAPDAPMQWRAATLQQIASALVAPYGITVTDTTGSTATIAKFVRQGSEPVFESLDRLCRARGRIATCDAIGNVLLSPVGSLRTDDALEVGVNAMTIDYSLDDEERYSDYFVVSQQQSDRDNARARMRSGTATDAMLGRTRHLRIEADEPLDASGCATQAAVEAASRMGRSITITVTVYGLAQSTGALWEPNRLVRLRDAEMLIDDEFIITETVYQVSRQEATTTLTLRPLLAYASTPLSAASGRQRNAMLPHLWAGGAT